MAMLMTNEVFARTWGERAAPRPTDDYWPALIERVKATHPDLLFIAEAYWDMEWTLQQQGFDFCYDKRLYDRLAHEGADVGARAPAGRRRLPGAADPLHREPRRAARGGHVRAGQARAAAVVMSTLQGARLYHDGQFDGHRDAHPGVPRPRARTSRRTRTCARSTTRLLRAVADSGLRDGDWRLCDCTGWPDNDSHRQLVAWCWRAPDARTPGRRQPLRAMAQARVRLPWDDLAGRDWELSDRLGGQRFERGGDELAADGLYVGLDPWASHFLAFAAGGG